jgi:glycerol-3-phosphate dehydrogenase
MHRTLDQLTGRQFDLLVIGGGICGLTIACDAAQRGLAVALVERHDFGSGTSFNHLRTIHGGLRYLQSLDLARARESIRERRTLARIAPWAVRPVPFVLPLSASLMKGTNAMRAGFLLDRVVARDRNDGVPSTHTLPGGTVIGAAEAIARYPVLRGMPMTGAAVWYDYVTTEADRLTFSWALAAAAHGAVLANYVDATALVPGTGTTTGVRATDRRTGDTIDIAARTIVNATGASLDRLLAPAGFATQMPVMKAMNLVTRVAAPPQAIGGRSSSGRNFFMVPWRGRAVFGTWESPAVVEPSDVSVRAADVAAFVHDINHAFPSLQIGEDDVTFVHRGVVPALVRPDGRVALDGHEQVHDHRRDDHPEIISVAGTKYTTARAVAEKVTTRLVAVLGRRPVVCRTAELPLPAPPADNDLLLRQAANEEMVVTLEDAVVRRTPLGSLGCPSEPELIHAAAVVGEALNWAPHRRHEEIEGVRQFYRDRQPI